MGPMKLVFLLFVALVYTSISNAFPGSPREEDINDPYVQQFLASTLIQVKAPPKGTDNELTTLVKVTKVTFQVVSGIKYTYNFEARGVKTHKLYTCSLSVISRPWAEGDVVQDYQCQHLSTNQLLSSLAPESTEELNDSNGNKACLGCTEERDVQDPFVQQFLQTTLTQVKAPPKGTDNELTTLIKVTRVTYQVVSGIKYTYEFEARGVKTQKLYNCQIVVLSQPWSEGETVQDFQCHHLSSNLFEGPSESSESQQLLETENALPGSPQEEDVNNPLVQQFLASTLTQVKAPPKGTDNELTTLVKVTKVTFQVVSGIKYTYNFEAKGIKTHKLYTCSLSVISQPWAEGDVVQDYQCQRLMPNSLLRLQNCLGCELEQNVQDPFVQQFLQTTLTQVKAPPKGTDNELTTLIKVTKATYQVISGVKYTYDFEARGVKTHKLYSCRIVLLSQPWAEGETVQDFQCHPLHSNLLQSSIESFEKEQLFENENAIPGAPQEMDVSDASVQQFLTSTLTQVKAPPKGTDNELTTLVKLTKVTAQVVSGIKYTYNFEARGVKTHKLYDCSLTVVSRPWAEGDVVYNFLCQHHL